MKRTPIHALASSVAALCMLGSTFAVELGRPGATMRMLWGVIVTGAAIVAGVVIGMDHVRHTAQAAPGDAR